MNDLMATASGLADSDPGMEFRVCRDYRQVVWVVVGLNYSNAPAMLCVYNTKGAADHALHLLDSVSKDQENGSADYSVHELLMNDPTSFGAK